MVTFAQMLLNKHYWVQIFGSLLQKIASILVINAETVGERRRLSPTRYSSSYFEHKSIQGSYQ